MNTETVELNMNEMEQVNGGTFDDNKYTDSEYASVGIKVEKHFIFRDDFWFYGKNIGYNSANLVVQSYKETGRIPSLEEVYNTRKDGTLERLVHSR